MSALETALLVAIKEARALRERLEHDGDPIGEIEEILEYLSHCKDLAQPYE